MANSFSDVINSNIPTLVDFYADWCGPCKAMNPVLKDLKNKMGDRINIIKVDADKNTEAASRYNVRGVPTLILFREGNILWQQAGAMQLAGLESVINQKLDTKQ